MSQAVRRSLALAALLAAVALAPVAAAAAPARAASPPAAPRRSAGYHQFTGVITALDKSTITVEKSGRAAKTMVFARDEQMRTQGELEKDARVTVWWRDEAGHPVAHRVVVKAGPETAAK